MHQQKKTSESKTFHLIELVWTKALLNLRAEVHHNYLSYLWWIIEPLMHMVVYYFVFGFLLQSGEENYSSFLLTGLIPWLWVSKCISTSSNSIVVGKTIMLNVGVQPIFFPMVKVLQSTLKEIPVFCLLIVFLWIQGYTPGIHWLALIPLFLLQAFLIISISCATAAIIPFIRDVVYLVPTGLTFLLFVSGIFYSYNTIPEKWQGLFLSNPIAFILKCYREIFLDGTWPDVTTLCVWLGICVVAFGLVLLIYKHLRYTFPRIVME